MIEAEVEVQESKGTLVMQLKKGIVNTEAQFDLATGKCTVVLMKEGKQISSHDAPTSANSIGKHKLRFANFDNRMTVGVDNKLPFVKESPTRSMRTNGDHAWPDLFPASLGAQNAKVVVSKLSVWRDIYYTREVT